MDQHLEYEILKFRNKFPSQLYGFFLLPWDMYIKKL